MSASLDDLLRKVGGVSAVLCDNAPVSEAQRCLADASVAALRDAGLFRLYTPRDLGGFEVDPVTAMIVFEELARIDGASGWNVQLSSAIVPAFAWFSDAAVSEIFKGGPDLIFAGTLGPPGRAVPTEGGFRLSGRWSCVSGCQHCAWLIGPGIVMNGDQPVVRADGQLNELLFAFRARDVEIIDSWHTLGLRATGSHDVRADGVFVPHHRATEFGPLTKPARAFGGPLYRMTIWPTTANLAATAVGIARASMDALVGLGRKTPAYTKHPLGERPMVHFEAARAEAALGAARAYLHASLRDGWESVIDGGGLDLQKKMAIQLATTHAIRTAADVTAIVHELAGMSAVRDGAGFHQRFRDAHMITQHAFGAAARFESVGRVMFGLESDWSYFSH